MTTEPTTSAVSGPWVEIVSSTAVFKVNNEVPISRKAIVPVESVDAGCKNHHQQFPLLRTLPNTLRLYLMIRGVYKYTWGWALKRGNAYFFGIIYPSSKDYPKNKLMLAKYQHAITQKYFALKELYQWIIWVPLCGGTQEEVSWFSQSRTLCYMGQERRSKMCPLDRFHRLAHSYVTVHISAWRFTSKSEAISHSPQCDWR